MKGSHSLEFFNGQILFRCSNGDGDEYKFVSPSAVAAAFRNAPIDSGWLPAGVVRCGGTAQGDFAALFVPAQQTRLQFEGRTRPLYVHLPPLVFFGIGSHFLLWAIKENSIQPEAELFCAPLPNVFGNGSICWGANKPPSAGPATITTAWRLFITSPFSSHAADNKSRRYQHDVGRLLRQLNRSRRKFPIGDLVRDGGRLDRTIDEIIGGTNRDGH